MPTFEQVKRKGVPPPLAIVDDPPKGVGKIEKVMGEFKRGKLHSGSKHGPMVKSKKQAMAIAMSEAGVSRKKY